MRITVKELRNLVLREAGGTAPSPESWNAPRTGTGTPDAMAGFRGKTSRTPGSGFGPGSEKTEYQRAEETKKVPQTHPQLVQALKDLIASARQVRDPKAVETLFRIVQAAVQEVQKLKHKTGTSGFGQAVGRSVTSSMQDDVKTKV